MDNMKFTGYWYTEKRIRYNDNAEKIALIVLMTCIMIAAKLCLTDAKKLKGINDDIKINEKAISFMKKEVKNKSISDSGIDKLLNIFFDSMYGKFQYRYIEIQNDRIEAKIKTNNAPEDINIIGMLQNIPNMFIEDLSTDGEDQSHENIMKVVLKVK